MQQSRYYFLTWAAFSIAIATIIGVFTAVSAEDILPEDAIVENKEAAAHDIINESTQNKEEDDKNLTYDGSDLIEWITSNGGFIHPNARIGLDPTGQYRGVFVKNVGGTEGGTEEGIEEDDLVASIPWYVSLSSDSHHVYIRV